MPSKTQRSSRRSSSASKTRKSRDFSYSKVPSSRIVKAELHKIHKYSGKLEKCIRKDDKLPGWVKKKIFNASQSLSDVYHYLDHRMMTK